jgi:CRP-like cAMP-binding protein
MNTQRQVQPQMLNAVSIAGITAFQTLTPPQRKAIVSKLERRDFQPGDAIIARAEPSTEVYFLISGRVRACNFSEEGKEVQFEDLEAGAMFGELAAIDGGGRTGDVVAISDTIVASMSQSNFLDSLDEHAGLSRYVMTRLTKVIRNHMARMVELSAHNVKIRLCRELARLAERQGEPRAGVIAISNPPTHADLAARIGSHREAVSREVKNLHRSGLITWTRTEHFINDLKKLKLQID